MPIEFEDGSFIDASDWDRIKRIIREQGRTATGCGEQAAEPETLPGLQSLSKKITKITSRDGVTVKVGNLEAKKTFTTKIKIKTSAKPFSEEYLGWTIEVWQESGSFACNYFNGDLDVRYFEAPYDMYADENAVFKAAKRLIDRI